MVLTLWLHTKQRHRKFSTTTLVHWCQSNGRDIHLVTRFLQSIILYVPPPRHLVLTNTIRTQELNRAIDFNSSKRTNNEWIDDNRPRHYHNAVSLPFSPSPWTRILTWRCNRSRSVFICTVLSKVRCLAYIQCWRMSRYVIVNKTIDTYFQPHPG